MSHRKSVAGHAVETTREANTIPRLLRPAEVADVLGVSERTLERWRMDGEGPQFISMSRKTIRYSAGAVEDFIDGRLKENTAQ